jgi:hypothetical protein
LIDTDERTRSQQDDLEARSVIVRIRGVAQLQHALEIALKKGLPNVRDHRVAVVLSIGTDGAHLHTPDGNDDRATPPAHPNRLVPTPSAPRRPIRYEPAVGSSTSSTVGGVDGAVTAAPAAGGALELSPQSPAISVAA